MTDLVKKPVVVETWDCGCVKLSDIPPNPYLHRHCPKCDASPATHTMRNYTPSWGEGDIHCGKCGEFVRTFSRD